nr:hypothetical protein [Tanacetum cinerariifolium]
MRFFESEGGRRGEGEGKQHGLYDEAARDTVNVVTSIVDESVGGSSYARAMIKLRADVKLKDNIVVAMTKLKNLKNPRHAARGVQVGTKVSFKLIKQVYRPISIRNNANSSGKKKQAVIASKEVSNSNLFDLLNSVEKDEELGKRGAFKVGWEGPNSDVFLTKYGVFNVASSSTSTNPIVERIAKIGRQNIDGKLTCVDDDEKPLPKVVSTKIMDSDSEVEDVGGSSYARAMIKLRADVKLKDNIVVVMTKLKNLKNPRHAARGVQVGTKVSFKLIKQVYRPISIRNNANSSGKKKQAVIASKEVSNSNLFDLLNSVEKDEELGKRGAFKVGWEGPNFDVFLTKYGVFNVAYSSTSNNPIVERIAKIERQNIDGKLTRVDDDEKPLPKVVSTKIMDSDSEVEDVVDDRTVFMASIGFKCGTKSGYGTNSLLEQ